MESVTYERRQTITFFNQWTSRRVDESVRRRSKKKPDLIIFPLKELFRSSPVSWPHNKQNNSLCLIKYSSWTDNHYEWNRFSTIHFATSIRPLCSFIFLGNLTLT